MKFTYVVEVVTGLNRSATDGESQGNCSNQDLVWGMDVELYKMVGTVFTPFTQAEKDVVDAERQAVVDKDAQLDAIDKTFEESESAPVEVVIDDVTYFFKAGYESSQYIDSARTLADNLNENDVELWDFDDTPHIFSKADANTIAIAVGLSFRTNYSAMKHAKNVLKEDK